LNKTDLINFIRITDPVGEYFEELGGIYCAQYIDRYIKNNSILIFMPNIIYCPLIECKCIDSTKNIYYYLVFGGYLKSSLKFRTLNQIFYYNFNMFGFNDYHIPWVFEFKYIPPSISNTVLLLTNNSIFTGVQKIPLIRRVFIE
jgi:hypothetical protein